jgi:hypothetical protein
MDNKLTTRYIAYDNIKQKNRSPCFGLFLTVTTFDKFDS